jgi:hypothetical protein
LFCIYFSEMTAFTLPMPWPPTLPVDILVKSNAAPSDLESRAARAHIEELESQLAYIDAARTELLASLEEHKGILSPIRMLPNEILGEIFFILAKAAFHFGDISEEEELGGQPSSMVGHKDLQPLEISCAIDSGPMDHGLSGP